MFSSLHTILYYFKLRLNRTFVLYHHKLVQSCKSEKCCYTFMFKGICMDQQNFFKISDSFAETKTASFTNIVTTIISYYSNNSYCLLTVCYSCYIMYIMNVIMYKLKTKTFQLYSLDVMPQTPSAYIVYISFVSQHFFFFPSILSRL